MKAQIIEDNRFLLEISKNELGVICKAITEVCKQIEEWEFDTRLGVTIEKANNFLKNLDIIRKRQEANIIDENIIVFEISKEELGMICNSMNEICNGIEVLNFDKTIGVGVEEANNILDNLISIYFNDANETNVDNF